MTLDQSLYSYQNSWKDLWCMLWSVLLYYGECWSLRIEDKVRLKRNDWAMWRWIWRSSVYKRVGIASLKSLNDHLNHSGSLKIMECHQRMLWTRSSEEVMKKKKCWKSIQPLFPGKKTLNWTSKYGSVSKKFRFFFRNWSDFFTKYLIA